MHAMLVLRTFGENQGSGRVSYLMYVTDTSEEDGPEWVFGGREVQQDVPLATAWLILNDLAAQVARRLESSANGWEATIPFDLV
jgi:hypothetical protein